MEFRELNQKFAERYQKMGTVTEDMIAPQISDIFKSFVNCHKVPEMEALYVQA